MRTISAVIDIGATPQQVWGVLADLDCYPQWNPLIRPAPGELAEGASLTLLACHTTPGANDDHASVRGAAAPARRHIRMENQHDCDKPRHHLLPEADWQGHRWLGHASRRRCR